MFTKQDICSLLDKKKISYEICEHEAVFTIGEMDSIKLKENELVIKNLFLKDDKSKLFYLVLMPGHKRADMKNMAYILGAKRLSFASQKDLFEVLKLTPGSVTPLGLLNAEDNNCVILAIDKELCAKRVGVHPNENTASVFIELSDLLKVINDKALKVVYY